MEKKGKNKTNEEKEKNKERQYVTGATGKIGKEVWSRLDKKNSVALVRNKSKDKVKIKEENKIETDFSTQELEEILDDAKTIIHLAGSTNFLNPEKMWTANVDLTRKIVEASPKNAQIVFASSISVYGKDVNGIIDEKTDVNPDTKYAKSKWEAEKIVSNTKNPVILRIGPVYGPQFPDYFKFLELLEKEKLKVIGDGENWVPLVHVEDISKSVVNGINAGSGKYVLADGGKQKKIFEIACNQLGMEMPGKTSFGIAMMIARLREWYSKIMDKEISITSEHVSILGKNRKFDCDKAQKELEFEPRDIEKGIKDMVEIYKKKKETK